MDVGIFSFVKRYRVIQAETQSQYDRVRTAKTDKNFGGFSG